MRVGDSLIGPDRSGPTELPTLKLVARQVAPMVEAEGARILAEA
ncbi:MAG: hypothetical protein V3V35_11745 [Dehalococcoidia bacterium]